MGFMLFFLHVAMIGAWQTDPYPARNFTRLWDYIREQRGIPLFGAE